MKTVSLKLAKQLKDAGIEIDTYFVWSQQFTSNWSLDPRHDMMHTTEFIASPSTDELLEWLPREMSINYKIHDLTLQNENSTAWRADYRELIVWAPSVRFADTPADALARLCLWVKENES